MYLNDEYLAALRAAKPDPKRVQIWIDALRSGLYTQLRGDFTNADETQHCCLAVLSHANDPSMPGLSDEGFAKLLGFEGKVSSRVEYMGCDYTFAPFAGANDEDGASFEDIAQFLGRVVQ